MPPECWGWCDSWFPLVLSLSKDTGAAPAWFDRLTTSGGGLMVDDPEDILAWQRLSERLTTSGALQEHDPARLREVGVKHVVYLAMADHPEALADPEGAF